MVKFPSNPHWLVLNPHLFATLCSSFSRENDHPLLICSSLSTAQPMLVKNLGCRFGPESSRQTLEFLIFRSKPENGGEFVTTSPSIPNPLRTLHGWFLLGLFQALSGLVLVSFTITTVAVVKIMPRKIHPKPCYLMAFLMIQWYLDWNQRQKPGQS